MSSPTSPEIPEPLERFPTSVQEAFARVQSTGDEAAVRVIVDAAVRDFLPERSRSEFSNRLRDDLSLVDDLGYDSLAIAEVVFFFEDLFQVTIDGNDVRTVRTIGDLNGFVLQKLQAQRRPA